MIDDGHGEQAQTMCQNKRGDWVTAIPEPYYLNERSKAPARKSKCRCDCGFVVKGYENYQGHYALRHILAL